MMNMSNVEYSGFVKRFFSQKSTKIMNIDGSIQCNNATDDDGGTYLYKQAKLNGSMVCTGLDYSTFASDVSDIIATAYLAYDAVIATAIALDKDALRSKVSFQGASGLVHFNNGRAKSQGYGLGDRLNGLFYKIYNFNPSTFHGGTPRAMEAFNKIGFFTPDTYVFKDCDIWTDISCAKPIFNTRDGLMVNDHPNVVEVQLPKIIRTTLSVAAAIALAVVCWFTFIVVLYMDDRIIKSAQPNMLLMMLFGGFLGSVRIILVTLDLTDAVCIVDKWVGHLAFVFVFGAMIVKTWRVGKVVSSGFSKVKVTQMNVNRIFWGFIGYFCVYLMLDTIFGQPHRTYEESFDEGLMLAYGAHLCWSTKEVAGAVNDSTLFLILFVCALTFLIVFMNITPTPTILITIMAAGFFIAVCGCITIMFAPKTNLIFSGAQVDENLKIVYSSKRASGVSSSSSNVISQLKDKTKNRAGDKYGTSVKSNNNNNQPEDISGRDTRGSNAVPVESKDNDYYSEQGLGSSSKKGKWTSPLNKGRDVPELDVNWMSTK
eukprot:gene2479-4822_t